ncbi:MAG: hypothetical protein EPO11_05545 [Gammaproteobacteria bacterium]|nr:MAG: hypothetical protein EPO11_05545 [Gammaproteobacteria bacterium]
MKIVNVSVLIATIFLCSNVYAEHCSRDVVTFSAQPPRYDGNYVEDGNRNYDPDMSTGDDNASIHPEMNIDY